MTPTRDDLARAGALERPDGDGRAGGSACGDVARITLAVEDSRIAAARFGVQGCPAVTAVAAWCARRAEGAAFLDAARLSLDAAVSECGLADGQRPCAAVAVDALHDALGGALAAVALPLARGRVAVAMSGGVDSAVAMLRLRAAGAALVGLTLRLWIDPLAPHVERACCSPEAVRRARDTCHALGLPHVTLDGREAFRRAVVEPFVAGYAAGETPNPCSACNGEYRLDALAAAADALGAETLATGHYARTVARAGMTLVARAADAGKDQSYMLATVPPALVGRLRFPLAEARKPEVRAEAEAAGLLSAGAPESQDVCFLGGGDLRGFLEREGVPFAAGDVVGEDGALLGRHAGAASLTPGQRRGLGVSTNGAALYVLGTDPVRNVVLAGPRARLARREVALREARLHVAAERVEAKLRARSPAVGASVAETGPGRATLLLDEPAYGVAAGQTAVLYDAGGAVIGAGVVDREG